MSKNIVKKYAYIFMALIMLISVVTPFKSDIEVNATLKGIVTLGEYVNFRTGPGTEYDKVKDGNGNAIVLQGGQELTILDTEKGGIYTWYKVKTTLSGKAYTGYVCADYVTVNTDEEETPSDDLDFEAKLKKEGFPESYKKLLRQVHEKYPNWEFKAIQTGISWDTLVSNEVNKQGQIKNLVWTSSSYPHYNWRSTNVGYDWTKDSWSPYDGSVWFAASDALVKYYLDPRTYLNEYYIFIFESLSYQSEVHNKTGVEAILKGSFMYDTTAFGEKKKYSTLIMNAAKSSNVSPYHIASRIRLEMGATAGVAANGKSNEYPGIYNYYNIGAYDGSNAVIAGLKWAYNGGKEGSYGRPWNSVNKSISGGASFLGTSYISVGQDTLYTQKFNVTNKGSLFSHQYMSNVQGASTEAYTNYTAYKNNNMLKEAMVFKIPVYSGMPSSPVKKPDDSGNPNNWLSSLDVSGYILTPSFSVAKQGSQTEYSLIVAENVGSVTVSAKTINSYASVSGTGVVNLKKGTNKVEVTCKAQNGNKRKYTITIVRGSASDDNVNDKYTVTDGYVVGVYPGTQADTFIKNLNKKNSSVVTKTGETKTGTVATGDVVKFDGGSKATVLIRGDVNGDGIIGVADLVYVKKHILGKTKLKGVYLKAADVDKNAYITVADLVNIKKSILGIKTIIQ